MVSSKNVAAYGTRRCCADWETNKAAAVCCCVCVCFV
uniref:Uncharacterized protein n=1 Tax=Anopheles quadriannulatus TaxID=34691 RepID=A0A182XT05_ANOQN